MIDLSGSRVLVTGGSRGIGAACSRFFARAGASVWVHYARDQASAEAVLSGLSELAAAAGAPVEHRSSRADFSERREVDRLFEEVSASWGGLDCLVNNAGVWVRNEIGAFDDAKLEETLRLNLQAVFWATERALPLMAGSKDPSIVNISSTAGQRGEAFYSPYAASKGALISVTKSWASELAPRVRVNSVAPGWVDTDMCTEPFRDGGREAIEKTIPLARIASADDIAGAVLFLASPLARHITGEILNVNGGSVLCG